MEGLLKEINKVRHRLKEGSSNKLLLEKPFAEGMYRFSMFMMNYYSRVRKNLNVDLPAGFHKVCSLWTLWKLWKSRDFEFVEMLRRLKQIGFLLEVSIKFIFFFNNLFS